ncbi:MAG: ATP-binding protein [Gemmatimonadales bacterium]
MRSFRSALALRAALQALAIAIVLLLAGTFVLRRHLVSMVDASLLGIAGIEAAITLEDSSATLMFRPEVLPPGPAGLPVGHWAELLAPDGRVLKRSANLDSALPALPASARSAASDGRPVTLRRIWRGEPIRSLAYPLGDSGERRVLHVATSIVSVERTLGRFVRLFALFGVAAALLAWFLGWNVAGRALRPAMALTEEAESIGVNELGRRLQVSRDLAEFHRMAEAFNGLLARLERAVTGIRRFTSDASHELRAPLTVLRGELELALSRPRSTEEYQEVLRRCLDEVLRLSRLADDLLTLTRVQGGVVGGKRTTVDLGDLVERAMRRQNGLAAGRGITIGVDGSAGLVEADGELLLRAVGGLIEHAIMATPAGGSVRIRLADGHFSSVEVTDGGAGLRQEEISGVFQRFYRSERARVKSTESGLGLTIARAVALSHGGTLDYMGNDPGASFRLSLPTVRPSGERAALA